MSTAPDNDVRPLWPQLLPVRVLRQCAERRHHRRVDGRHRDHGDAGDGGAADDGAVGAYRAVKAGHSSGKPTADTASHHLQALEIGFRPADVREESLQ